MLDYKEILWGARQGRSFPVEWSCNKARKFSADVSISSISLAGCSGWRLPLFRCSLKGMPNCPIHFTMSIHCPIAARFRVFLFAEDVSLKASTCSSGSSMRRSNLNSCKNIFSLTSKEYVSRESMLILD